MQATGGIVPINSQAFIETLDAAIQSHLEWTRRVLRCAVLHESPGEDVMQAQSHLLCRLGRWLMANRASLERLDAKRFAALEDAHRDMHDAIRTLCHDILQNRPSSPETLQQFEQTQVKVVDCLQHFKTLLVGRISQIDVLTGLPLRSRMQDDYEQMLARCRRQGWVLGVFLADIDHFKQVNDEHGHAAGDVVLRDVAMAIRRSVRNECPVYRYGGEEFVAFMELARPEIAQVPAQRVLRHVQELEIQLPDGCVVRHPTLTIGIAIARKGEPLADVLRRADVAMYEGKHRGRNCYVLEGAP